MDLPDLYLASASPRRHELLTQLGVRFAVLTQDVPEQRANGESPEAYVQRLARQKAQAGWQGLLTERRRLVLGSDTTVVVDDVVLEKPADRCEALAMLARLSGREHRVLTAVAVVGETSGRVTEVEDLAPRLRQYRELQRLSESRVYFRQIETWEREAYWASGEPVGKAGGYAIQGLGAMFVERLEGSYSGVMGLPLFESAELLHAFGIQLLPVGKS